MKCLPIIGSATLLLLLAATTRADISGFGNFSSFQVNQSDAASIPTISSSTIHLLSGSWQYRSIFYKSPQSISQFTASFTYVNNNNADGACFVLQDSAAGANAVGNNGMGYIGISGNSIAVVLQSFGSPGGGSGYDNATGYFTNGNIGSVAPNSVNPVIFNSGDPINVSLTYNGSVLQEYLFDTTTSASYNTSYLLPTSIPTVLGGSTAYVGFTAGNGNRSGSQDIYFSNFQFTSGAVPEPASLGILSIGVIGMLVLRRRA